MKPGKTVIVSIMLLIWAALAVAGQDLFFFSDDYYKSLGEPDLKASPVDPLLTSGRITLSVDLANAGEMEELIAINSSGKKEDILQEIKEEMHSPDALSINATLIASGPLLSTGSPQYVARLPAGRAVRLTFNATVDKNASGWYDLPLHLDYEKQADVSVRDGKAFPMLQAESRNLTLRAFADGEGLPVQIIAARCDLSAGSSGRILAAFVSKEDRALHNCTARLQTAAPFHAGDEQVTLGDLMPGETIVSEFAVQVDSDAASGDYLLTCDLACREKRITLPLPITLSSRSWLQAAANAASRILPGLVLLAVPVIFLMRKRAWPSFRRKKRWR